MGVAGVAVRDGARRVNQAPVVLLAAWLLTLAVSTAPALVIRSAIANHLGDSLAADSAASGTNYEWMQEFDDEAQGLSVTFRPTIVGFGAVLDSLSGFLDRSWQPGSLILVTSAFIGLWIFLAGGVIDRYARDRNTGAYGFFGACGAFFFRFLRLAVVQAIVYGLLFGPLHWVLFNRVYQRLIRDVTVERTAFGVRVALYLVFLGLVGAWNLLFDYARVRAIVEDRRSMIGALAGAYRFIRRNAGWAIAVYAIDVAAFLLAIALYALVAPGVGPAGPAMWVDFVVAQVYVVARLWVKLLFWASETALFQSRLAHAGYIARREPSWPDSPIAEAIT